MLNDRQRRPTGLADRGRDKDRERHVSVRNGQSDFLKQIIKQKLEPD